MNKRFALTLLTLFIIFGATALAIFLAKGYRYSTKTGMLTGTGIISITSVPDQASVFLDGHLTTATNANISSLIPRDYDVKITKDGFIPWEKQVTVKEGLVSQVKATLYPAIPTVYPLTYNGVEGLVQSPDHQQLAYIVPESSDLNEASLSAVTTLKKSGIWVWTMSNGPLSFAGGPEPHQVATLIPGVDYSKATLRFSPDSSQILVTLPDRSLLLDVNKSNDFGQDITAILQPTLVEWAQQQQTQDTAKIMAIKNPQLRQEASSAAVLKWSDDGTKFLYCTISCDTDKSLFKVADLSSNHTFTLKSGGTYNWLADSRHLYEVESPGMPSPNPAQTTSNEAMPNSIPEQLFPMGRISVLEFDGSNVDDIYAGNFDPSSVYGWPDYSRLVFISAVPTATGNKPNLFGVNLK